MACTGIKNLFRLSHQADGLIFFKKNLEGLKSGSLSICYHLTWFRTAVSRLKKLQYFQNSGCPLSQYTKSQDIDYQKKSIISQKIRKPVNQSESKAGINLFGGNKILRTQRKTE